MTNHPNRKRSIPTVHVSRMYDQAYRPASIWNCDADRVCTAEELEQAIAGELRLQEARFIAGHPSYGRSNPDTGENWPSVGRTAGYYTLTPENVRQFVRA
jgi:hypothetical protein